MSTTTLAPTPVIEALMGAISRLTREEQETLIQRVQGQLNDEESVPQWHLDILEERRRRVVSGEEKYVPWAEAKEQLQSAVHARLARK